MNNIVIVRGGGDIATGTIQKLYRAGFLVLIIEIEEPTCIRRTVSCAQAMFSEYIEIEDIKVRKTKSLEEINKAWQDGEVPIIADPEAKYVGVLKPVALVDAILAKKNLGTKIDMAPITIGLGPGFEAGVDVDIVIETNRGHNLARLIFEGKAQPNTGNPGNIQGYTTERILRSPDDGIITVLHDIGSVVEKDQTVGYVNGQAIKAGLTGLVRGMIGDQTYVSKNMKIGDVDPRIVNNNIYTISDKARAIGGGVLEAILIQKIKLEEKGE